MFVLDLLCLNQYLGHHNQATRFTGGLNDRVKKIAQKGWFEMTYTGVNLNIEPTIPYNQLSHAIF